MRFPRHHFLGPGNDAFEEEEPVDEDDRIARTHDLLYEVSADDVSAADELAVDQFFEDFSTTGNWHSLIGGVGIQAKRSFEGVFGQQYPMTGHRGRDKYSAALRELSKIYQEEKARGNRDLGTWAEFQKLYFGDILRELHGGAGGSGISNKRHADDISGDTPAEKRPAREPESSPESPGLQSLLDNYNWDEPFSNMDNMDVETMEAVANPSEGATGVSGKSGSGKGTGRSASGPATIVTIPRNIKSPFVTHRFHKNWIFFSYGFIHKVIPTDDKKASNYITPLMLIPVDLLGLYLDPTEFTLLRGKSVVTEVRARVKPLGCRVNFQTSASTTTWATSEFVAIGQRAIGLNLTVPGRNRIYTPNTNKPMEIETQGPLDNDTLLKKLYGKDSWDGAISLVPRHLNMYYTPITATNNNDNSIFTHSNGPPKIDNFVDRFLINTCIGSDIVNYSYKPKLGIITDTRSYDGTNISNKYIVASRASAVEVNPFIVAGVRYEGRSFFKETADEQDKLLNNWTNNVSTNFMQTIEMPECYDVDRGHIHGNVQPQVHVGLTAVPAINPGSDRTDFQNSACYWSVEVECTVHEYINSAFHWGNVHTHNPQLYPQGYTKQYHSGNVYNHHLNLENGQFYAAAHDEQVHFPVSNVGSISRRNLSTFTLQQPQLGSTLTRGETGQ